VAELVDGGPGLAGGLGAQPSGVAPLQREVLPEEQPGLVGRLVELGPADVGVEPEEVGERLARDLLAQGAEIVLGEIREVRSG